MTQHCSRDITDLEITQLNQDFDNSTIEADVSVTCDSIPLFARHLTGLNARCPENMRKDDNDMTIRLLHVLNGNLSPTMHISALKEIRAPADKRELQDTSTGMRDFAAAVQELDEVWRAITSTLAWLVKPASCRQPGGVRVADVSLADYEECEDKEAYLAASTSAGRQIFTFAALRAQSTCYWNCRGFGHVRSACTSSDGFRSITHVISALQTSPDSSGKGARARARAMTRAKALAGAALLVAALALCLCVGALHCCRPRQGRHRCLPRGRPSLGHRQRLRCYHGGRRLRVRRGARGRAGAHRAANLCC